MTQVPADFPVQPLQPEQVSQAKDPVTCGTCGLTWDDGVSTSYTPAPGARCPFEAYHQRQADLARDIIAIATEERYGAILIPAISVEEVRRLLHAKGKRLVHYVRMTSPLNRGQACLEFAPQF